MTVCVYKYMNIKIFIIPYIVVYAMCNNIMKLLLNFSFAAPFMCLFVHVWTYA